MYLLRFEQLTFNVLKLFSESNHILHREKLNRDDHDIINGESEADFPASYGSQTEGKSKIMDANLKETIKSSDSTYCRQEIVWMSRDFNMNLSEMSESYGDLLHLCLHSKGSADSTVIDLPQRSGKRQSEVQHECRGYRREEITLTPDAFRNEILVFGNPSVNERCGVCGRGGCYTCRDCGQKCDQRPDAERRCETCLRLHLQYLDFSVQFPNLLGENYNGKEICAEIERLPVFLGVIDPSQNTIWIDMAGYTERWNKGSARYCGYRD
ncbi:hypothetical protein GYMLUDRAFT_910518 [Collybiopsis luxurians FD-317 M1]|nr:hypothetical protein GYMLUDRAFT_910518 [Collybiopsis luxurians FD-317 M1]